MKLYEEWLLKAERDLLTAQILWESHKGVTDTAVYHTQQSAEKALKSLFVFEGKPIEKTHNIRFLHEVLCQNYPELTPLSEAVFFVSPFDTLFRYPGMELFPDEETTEQAIRSAEQILISIKQLITNLKNRDKD